MPLDNVTAEILFTTLAQIAAIMFTTAWVMSLIWVFVKVVIPGIRDSWLEATNDHVQDITIHHNSPTELNDRDTIVVVRRTPSKL